MKHAENVQFNERYYNHLYAVYILSIYLDHEFTMFAAGHEVLYILSVSLLLSTKFLLKTSPARPTVSYTWLLFYFLKFLRLLVPQNLHPHDRRLTVGKLKSNIIKLIILRRVWKIYSNTTRTTYILTRVTALKKLSTRNPQRRRNEIAHIYIIVAIAKNAFRYE